MGSFVAFLLTIANACVQALATVAMLALVFLGLAIVAPGTFVGNLASGLLKFLFALPEFLSTVTGAGIGRVAASAAMACLGTLFAWVTELVRRVVDGASRIWDDLTASPLQWLGRFIVAPTVTCAVTVTSSARVIEWVDAQYRLGWLATFAIIAGTCYLLALGMMRVGMSNR